MKNNIYIQKIQTQLKKPNVNRYDTDIQKGDRINIIAMSLDKETVQ